MNLKRLLLWSIIGTGISSISTELVTVREFLTQFHGNEITISVFFFAWLLLTGLGSLLAKASRRPSINLYLGLLLVFAIWPLCQIVLIRYLRDVFFIHGVSPGFYGIVLYVALISAPYCLITGFVLPYSQKVVNAAGHLFDSGQLYLTDNIGDILGGVIFSFVLVYFLTPFRVVLFSSFCLLVSIMAIFVKLKKPLWLGALVVVTSVFVVVAMDRPFELQTLRGQYGDVKRYVESPYGRIIISQEGEQYTFWESGTPLYSDADVMRAEEKVHYVLSQRRVVRNVLLISGGLGETLAELSKYQPERIDYVELDPRLTLVAAEMGVITPMRGLHVINTDGRLFLKQISRKYDFIIVDLPDPDTFQINRFFTIEFFSLAKSRLTSDGVLSVNMQYSQNFISKIRKLKLGTLYHTAKEVFKNVLVIPGGEAFFLCSDGKLSSDIPKLLEQRSIKTSYVEGFFYGNVTPERIDGINKDVSTVKQINSDFEPILMRITLREWFAKQGTSPIPFAVALGITVVVYLVFLRKEEYVLFTTGMSNMGAEMLVVYSVQILFGYVYLKIGVIVTAFLFGLLPGASLGNRYKVMGRRALLYSEVALVVMLAAFFIWAAWVKVELSSWIFLLYGMLFSMVCGFQFPAVAHAIGEERSPAAGCLASDLAGAAVGTLLVGTVLIPMWGIAPAALALILCKGATTMIFVQDHSMKMAQLT